MIRATTIRGAVFGDRTDGDARSDPTARHRIARELGIDEAWVTMHQIHGSTVRRADRPGDVGDADAIVTAVEGLPLVVATADCVPVVLEGDGGIAVAHAGWRGVAAGIVPAVIAAMVESGDPPLRAVVGPHIGPCCYEVGPEVVAAVGHEATTTWGTVSVDLRAAVVDQLEGIAVEHISACTHHDDRFESYRRDGTRARQVTVAWRM